MLNSASRPKGSSLLSILGASLDVGNRGVLALGVSLAGLLTRIRPGSTIVFHYGHVKGGWRRLKGDPPIDVQVQNCRLSPGSACGEHILVILALALVYRLGIHGPAMRNPWLRALIDAEFVGDITGGDSFSDIYGFRRFLKGSLPLITVAVLGRPYTLLPQTYGPFRYRASRWLAGALLRRATSIFTRDLNCEPTVLGLSGRRVKFCPDVAFTLSAIEPSHVEYAPGNVDFSKDDLVVGVNVSGLLYMGGYTGRNMFGLRSEYRAMIDNLVDRLLVSTPAKILLVPHTFGSEREEEACASILKSASERHAGRVFMLTTPLNEREIKWVIGQTKLFVGSRMHACIAALSQCVPAVGLAYSDKFLGVFESAGVGEANIDLRRADVPEVIYRTLLALERREDLASQLRARIPDIKAQIVEVFRELLPDSADALARAPQTQNANRDARPAKTRSKFADS